jgi:hypothetical protein
MHWAIWDSLTSIWATMPKRLSIHSNSLAIAREIKNRQGEGNALGNLGVAYRSLGNSAKAIEYSQQ